VATIQKPFVLNGLAITIDVLPHLTASRGKLLSGQSGLGQPVHAASFIRQRRIVLERQLLQRAPLARRILVHELFHFVWPRCANQHRRNFESLLREELNGKARGELGESAETHKQRWLENRLARTWSDYVVESFCDTAAWYFSRPHPNVALARRWRTKRARFFAKWLLDRPHGWSA
jgi:hypothetical protein